MLLLFQKNVRGVFFVFEKQVLHNSKFQNIQES